MKKLLLIITLIVYAVSFIFLNNYNNCVHEIPEYIPVAGKPNIAPVYVTKTPYEDLGEFRLTAYCNCSICCGAYAGMNKTASGTTPTEGRTIAVDPDVIPYGSEVYINGQTYIAEDCGGAIKGNRIDVYFNTHQAAWNFGSVYAEVRIRR